MKYISFIFLLFITTNHYSQEDTLPPAEEVAVPNTNAINIESKQVEKWTETMEFGISDQRIAIVKKIRFDKNTNAITLLENFFSSESNPLIKEEMIYAFMDMKHNANTQFWSDLFANETNVLVLQRAAYAVEQMNIPIANAVFSNATNYLNDPKAMRYSATAIQALGKLRYIEALPMITEIATNMTNHQDLRGASVVALGMYQDDSLIPTLQNFLTNQMESRLIRRYAALAIGRTENPQAVDILSPIAINEQEEQTVRLNSISGLGYLVNNEDIIPILESLTRADNTAVRTEAIKSLGRLKVGQKILEYKAANDPEAIVRREAKNALKNFESPQNETQDPVEEVVE
ncbi:MAG: HEAT repeat domain-containing protein [Brevinema sp.]